MLPHECEDITKNAWHTPLNAQCNIEYRLQYSLFFTFCNFHRNRLVLIGELSLLYFPYFFWVSILDPVFAIFPTSTDHKQSGKWEVANSTWDIHTLPHKCEDITKNAWRTPLNAQCNIE